MGAENRNLQWFISMSENIPLHKFLGLDKYIYEDGYGEIRIPITDNLRNASKAVHGGIYYFLCDITATLAFSTVQTGSAFYVTHDINVSILSAAFTGNLTARANVLKSGKRLGFVECRIYDDDDRILAIGRITKTVLPKPETL